jgi:hydroxypyruvate isomerase
MAQYAVNLSAVYGQLPLLERAAAARADGFTEAESWWEFGSAVPDPGQVDEYLGSIEANGLKLLAMNSYGGDGRIGETGIASLPDRDAEFRDNIAHLKDIAVRTGARKFNVTFGLLDARFSKAEQFDMAARQYEWAAQQMAEIGGTLLIEELSGKGGAYPFINGYDAHEFIETRLGDAPNVKLLFDTYHLAAAGADLLRSWRDLHEGVGHVQFADFPGRGKPGSGKIDFAAIERAILADGYRDQIVLEYLPVS